MSTNHFNELTEAEHERLSILAEECAETIQIIGKIFRHGYESSNPLKLDGPSNREMLEEELGHIEFAKQLMFSNDDIRKGQISKSKRIKKRKVWVYLHHQEKI